MNDIAKMAAPQTQPRAFESLEWRARLLVFRIKDAGRKLGATFRERFVEWGLAISQLIWGAMVMATPGLFDRPFYALFAMVAPQWAWGSAAMIVGSSSLIVLAINGAWHRTPMLRMLAAITRLIIWSGLTIGASHTPSVAYLGLLFGLDTVCLVLAARDHGLVLVARGAARKDVGD